MTMTLDGALNGAKLMLTARGGSLGRLQGGPVSALAGTWPINIDATMGSATLHVEGGINHPDQLRAYQVRVTGHAANLADLQPLVHFAGLPPMADVNGTAFVSDGTEGELLTSQVSLHTGASDLSAWVPGLLVKDAVLSAPGPGQLAQLTVTGTYQSQPLNVSLTAVQPERLNIGGPLRVSLSAQAAGATLSAHGTMPPGLHAIGRMILRHCRHCWVCGCRRRRTCR
jgi:hypothetical protein